MFKLTVSLRISAMVLHEFPSVFAMVLGYASSSGSVKLRVTGARFGKPGNKSRKIGSK
jgi:hypothetical protein